MNTKDQEQKGRKDGRIWKPILGFLLIAGSVAGLTAGFAASKNNNEVTSRVRHTFKDVMSRETELNSVKDYKTLSQVAVNVGRQYKHNGFDKYTNEQFQRDFGVILTPGFDVRNVIWYDYVMDKDHNIVMDYQYKLPPSMGGGVANGIFKLVTNKDLSKHEQIIVKNMYEVKGQRFEERESAIKAANLLIEKSKIYKLNGIPQFAGVEFKNKVEAIEKFAEAMLDSGDYDSANLNGQTEPYDLTHVNEYTQADATKMAWKYDDKYYATSDYASDAWLKDGHQVKVPSRKGQTFANIMVDGVRTTIKLPEYDFGNAPTTSDLKSKLSWKLASTGAKPSTGRLSVNPTDSIGMIYIDDQKVVLRKLDGTPIVPSDWDLETLESGTVDTHTYNHHSTFEIDGQEVTAVRTDGSNVPLSESDFRTETVVRGVADIPMKTSKATFEIDGQTIVAERADEHPIERGDIHASVAKYGHTSGVQDFDVATFEIDGQKVTVRKVFDENNRIKINDVLLSKGAPAQAPQEAVATKAEINIGGKIIHAVRPDGGAISPSDFSVQTTVHSQAPTTGVQSAAEITLYDGTKMNVVSTNATPITKDMFLAHTSAHLEIKQADGTVVRNQEFTITPKRANSHITIPQKTFVLKSLASDVPDQQLIKSVRPLVAPFPQVGVHQEVLVVTRHGVELTEDNIVVENGFAGDQNIVIDASKITTTTPGKPYVPGHGVEIMVSPIPGQYLEVDKSSIVYHDPDEMPGLWDAGYMATRLYIRNWNVLGKQSVYKGEREEVDITASPGIHLSKSRVVFGRPTHPIIALHLIKNFTKQDGHAMIPGVRQQVRIITSPEIKLSKTSITFRRAIENAEVVNISNFNHSTDTMTSFGKHQVIGINVHNGLISSVESITMHESGADIPPANIKRDVLSDSTRYILHNGIPAKDGVVETGTEFYELYYDGHKVLVDDNNGLVGQPLKVERQFSSFGTKEPGHSVGAPPMLVDSQIEMIEVVKPIQEILNTKADALKVLQHLNLVDASFQLIQTAGATGVDESLVTLSSTIKHLFYMKGDKTHAFATEAQAIAYIKTQTGSNIIEEISPNEYWEKVDHTNVYASLAQAYFKLISRVSVTVKEVVDER